METGSAKQDQRRLSSFAQNGDPARKIFSLQKEAWHEWHKIRKAVQTTRPMAAVPEELPAWRKAAGQ